MCLRLYRLLFVTISWWIFYVINAESIYTKSVHLHSHHPNDRPFYNEMMARIKQILNMNEENSTLDNYVMKMFKVDNQNPTYVFMLPDVKNRTVIFNRSDFMEADFPNVTMISKIKSEINATLMNANKTFTHQSPKEESSLKTEKNLSQNLAEFHAEKLTGMLAETNFNDDDDKINQIVEENVRTERNFIKFMEELNDERNKKKLRENKLINNHSNHQDEIVEVVEEISTRLVNRGKIEAHHYRGTTQKQPHLKKYIPPERNQNLRIPSKIHQESTKHKNQDLWDALGLEGWSGDLSEVGDEFEDGVERPPSSSDLLGNSDLSKPGTDLASIVPNYDPLAEVNVKSTVTKYNHPSTYTDYEIDNVSDPPFHFQKVKKIKNPKQPREEVDIDHQINIKLRVPEQLSKLLQDEKSKLNLTEKNKTRKPKWPITSSRALHKDSDVYIARANNPFGHSTRWKWSNSSNNVNNNNEQQPREGRLKRDVLQLYSMVKCATGCDPLIYKGYGCYCGFLGSGQALDGIDRCCKMHDYCYEISSCPTFLEYFVPYLWKCYKGRPLCAIDHGEWGGPGSCASRLCECDLILAKCLRRYYCPRKRTVCTSSPWRLFQNYIMDF